MKLKSLFSFEIELLLILLIQFHLCKSGSIDNDGVKSVKLNSNELIDIIKYSNISTNTKHSLIRLNRSHKTKKGSTNSAEELSIDNGRRNEDLLTGRNRRCRRPKNRRKDDLSLWVDEQQVKIFSGHTMEVYVIVDGQVNQLLLDPDFEKHLPVIPEEVASVNFTWYSSKRRSLYHFDLLTSNSPSVLNHPVISIPQKGRVPKRPKTFSVMMQCTGNISGVGSFSIGLALYTKKGVPLPHTPIKLTLRKECYHMGKSGDDPDCDQQCQNDGICDHNKKCRCPDGYMGPLCATALCYPQCMNGGTCSSPGKCSCPQGYQGRHCEGGICSKKCQNGGKCIQKDTCACAKGYYGNRCEFSKCVIPCMNGGRCRDVNRCRCASGFGGNHCEILLQGTPSLSNTRCQTRCRDGKCTQSGECNCHKGFTGRWCRRRGKTKLWTSDDKHRHKKIWV